MTRVPLDGDDPSSGTFESVLVVEDGATPRREPCRHLLDGGPGLVLAHRRSLAEVLDVHRDVKDLHVFLLDDASVDDAREGSGTDGDDDGEVRAGVAVDGPPGVVARAFRSDDLPSIGLAVDGWLDDVDPRRDPAVCLGSIDGLTAAVDRATAFRFLHATSGHVRSAGVRVHAHIGTGDDRTVTALSTLFDAVLTYDDATYHRRETLL